MIPRSSKSVARRCSRSSSSSAAARSVSRRRASQTCWPQASSQLNYLYVVGIAAGKASRPDLEQRALGRLIESGRDSPELHLLLGKAHINREEYDEAQHRPVPTLDETVA